MTDDTGFGTSKMGGSAHNDLSSRERSVITYGGLDSHLFAAGPWSAFQTLGNPL